MGPAAAGNAGEYDLVVPVQVQGADALLLVAHDGSVELRGVQVRALLACKGSSKYARWFLATEQGSL